MVCQGKTVVVAVVVAARFTVIAGDGGGCRGSFLWFGLVPADGKNAVVRFGVLDLCLSSSLHSLQFLSHFHATLPLRIAVLRWRVRCKNSRKNLQSAGDTEFSSQVCRMLGKSKSMCILCFIFCVILCHFGYGIVCVCVYKYVNTI